MEHETVEQQPEVKKCRSSWSKGKDMYAGGGGNCGGAYGLGVAGAAVYYIQHADTFWIGVLGILKAIIWPAMLVYNMLGFLNM